MIEWEKKPEKIDLDELYEDYKDKLIVKRLQKAKYAPQLIKEILGIIYTTCKFCWNDNSDCRCWDDS